MLAIMRLSVSVWVSLSFLSGWLGTLHASDSSRLSIARPGADGWVRLGSTYRSNEVVEVHASSNLTQWTTFAVTHEQLLNYPDAAPSQLQRFYRLNSREMRPNDEFKNQALFPSDAFRSAFTGPQEVRWIKFAILIGEPWRVYYQPSTKYLFHYDFATRYLPPFIGMPPAEFDTLTLHTNDQVAVLGALLFPPATNLLEFGIQLVGLDAFSAEQTAAWLDIVRATVHANKTVQTLYIPTSEQRAVAEGNAPFFAERGFPVAAADRWTPNEQCYAPGWALGRLVFVTGSQIQAAYNSGQLTSADILVTDVVPAEVPFVAGIIALSASTPNSHVAILSRAFGTPFVYLPAAADQTNLLALVGHEILVRADAISGSCDVKILDMEGRLDAAARAALHALKAPRPLNIPAKQRFGQYWAPTDTMTPADIRFFGGKAANFGFLRQSVPTNSPEALAFSFDLWDDFMDQLLPNSANTLRAEIAMRLAPFTNYPPDLAALETALTGVQSLITGTARFSAALRVAITNALVGFEATRRIRFRSSTNVEDSEQFTGAGLYDSYSGCLLDDLDADTTGPSHCDPTENNERGVFRAIQRVYASFYNYNAFLERLRHGMDESRIAMGVLVHYSFPDEEELANGVATLQNNGSNMQIDLVTQLGAESVTNPDGSAVPESVRANRFGTSVYLDLIQRSSRVPLGAYVMEWEQDYRGMVDLLVKVTAAYRGYHTNKTRFLLDFEYKKTAEGLSVKQVREIPGPTTNSWVPFLVNQPLQYRVFQGEYGTVFGNHRLKSTWSLETANRQLAATNLSDTFYTAAAIEYISNGLPQSLGGPLQSFPNFTYGHSSYSLSQEITTNQWTMGSVPDQQAWTLTTIFPNRLTEPRGPILMQSDFSASVHVAYPKALPAVYLGNLRTVTSESIRLEITPPEQPGDLLQTRSFQSTNGVQIVTTFYWPPHPQGAGGYTAPLVRWNQTQISGVVSNTVTLRGYYSQTYRPGHHNFDEEFLFEPRLEPGLPSETLAQLQAANVELVYARRANGGSVLWIMGVNGQFRRIQ